MIDEEYTQHSPTKVSATLKSPTPKIAKAVLGQIASIGHPISKEILEQAQAVQATLKDKPVLAFPMHTGSMHCINYTTYPVEPRFLNSPPLPLGGKCQLGILNKPVDTASGDFLIKPSVVMKDTVFLLEGVWDALDLASLLPTWALPGVNNLQNSWLPLFKDKKVFILFDNDDPGKKYADSHAKKLLRYAKSVKILKLPTLVNKTVINDVGDLMKIKDLDVMGFINNLIGKTSDEEFNILEAIREIINGKGNANTRSALVTDLIIEDIECNAGGVIPFNSRQEFALIINGRAVLVDEKIDIHLSQYYDCLPSDPTWRYVKDRLYAYALKKAEARVDLYSTYKNEKVYIGFKDEGLLVVDRHGHEWALQGKDGVYVKSGNRRLINNKKKLKGKLPLTMDEIFDLFIYEGDRAMYKFVLRAWFYQTFFKPNMRPILAIVGEPGCGKTLLMKLIKGALFGYGGGIPNPNSVPEEDYSFNLILKEYKYLFLDEVNENNPQMKSRLRMIATGEEALYRPKYGRRNIRFRPQAWLAIAAHSPKFRDVDIAQRLTLIKLQHPKDHIKAGDFIHEADFLKSMDMVRPKIWESILVELTRIMANLEKHKEDTVPLEKHCRQFELADFAYKGWPDERELCLKTFNAIEEGQNRFSAEFDPLFDLLEQHLIDKATMGNGAALEFAGRDLHKSLQQLAKSNGIKSFPASTRGFAAWVNKRKELLKEEFGMEKIKDYNNNSWNYKFNYESGEAF